MRGKEWIRSILKQIKRIEWTMAGLMGLLLIWGLIEPRLIDVEHEFAVIPDLPDAWDGRQVAQISDFQVGMFLDNIWTIRRIIDRIVEERPALVLITGDFVVGEEPGEELKKVIELLRPLTGTAIPVYAVLGNHAYGVTPSTPSNEQFPQRMREALEAIGVHVLLNEAVALEPPGEAIENGSQDSLFLVGIGPHWPDKDKPAVALTDVPDTAPRIVMMHNPDTFGALPPYSAPLAVAGHTHGGQIRLPFTPEWTWLTYVWNENVHAAGWIDGYGAPGNHLYVNRGIGFSHVPLRINCMPELTLFTLHQAGKRDWNEY